MSTEDLENRVLSLEQELNHIRNYYQRTLSYQHSDPEAALWMARKATEAICRQIFVKEISPNIGTITLEELLVQLSKKRLIPKGIEVPIRTIQQYGNFGTHDQGHDNITITQEFAEPCLKSLSTVVDWYFNEYLGQSMDFFKEEVIPAQQSQPQIPVSKPWWRTPHIFWIFLFTPFAGIPHAILGQWVKGILVIVACVMFSAITSDKPIANPAYAIHAVAVIDAFMVARARLNGQTVGRFKLFPRKKLS